MVSLILDQYQRSNIVYKGHVTLGKFRGAFNIIASMPLIDPPFLISKGEANAILIAPRLVCTVRYMGKSSAGGLRQTVFKELAESEEKMNRIEIVRPWAVTVGRIEAVLEMSHLNDKDKIRRISDIVMDHKINHEIGNK